MKKLLISTLLLLAATTVQIQPYFIRGAVYENKKTGQLIVLFSDVHEGSHSKLDTHENIIRELEKIDENSSLIIVEDVENKTIHKDNLAYQKTTKFLNSFYDRTCPLLFLESNLLKSNLNVKNVECRYINSALCQAKNFLKCYLEKKDVMQEEFKESCAKFSLFAKELPKKLCADLLIEIETNIKNLQIHAKEIAKSISNYPENYRQTILEYFQAAINSIPAKEKYSEFVKQIQSTDALFLVNKKQNKPFKNISNMTNPLIDADIIYNILKNNNKKIIVIFAGASHAVNTEKFIRKIGYNLNEIVGLDNINLDLAGDTDLENKVLQFNPKPIDITRLFANKKIQALITLPNLQSPKDKMLKRKIASFSEYEQIKSLTNICEILQLNRKPVRMAKIFETLENKKYKNKNQYSSLESFENNTSKLSTKNTRLEINIGKINENISFETVYQDEPTKLFNICYKDKESCFATDLAKKVEFLTNYLNYYKHEIALNL